jgi:hypothetical protein
MGCRCQERKAQLSRAGAAVVRGDGRTAMAELARSAQSFVQDTKSRQTRREMLARLAASTRR